MNGRAIVLLLALSAVFLLLVSCAATRFGMSYEEVVPYVLHRLDIQDVATTIYPSRLPRLVASSQLPYLSLELSDRLVLPLLNQSYMTNHLSFVGAAVAQLDIDPVLAVRLWHAAFGTLLLWILYDLAILLDLGQRAAMLTPALTATSFPFTFMYTWARFDESLASSGAVVVLWSALRYRRSAARGWLWLMIGAAALAISGKVTATWPLLGLLLVGGIAGWRPPSLRDLWRPILVFTPLFMPMAYVAVAGVGLGQQVSKRVAFLADLFTTDVVLTWARNLVDYLGNWGGILSELISGSEAHPPNNLGRAIILGCIVWMIGITARSDGKPRRLRFPTQALIFLCVELALVAMFFREHRDYQFSILVPLHAIALAAFLDAIIRSAQRMVPGPAAVVLVCALPLLSNLWDQRQFHRDLTHAHTSMMDLRAQRDTADWLVRNDASKPIVVTFHEVGVYDFLSRGRIRPVYGSLLMRHAKDFSDLPDLSAAWRQLLGDGQEHFVILPLGENAIEAQHFDEPAIRAALSEVATVRTLSHIRNQRGDAILSIVSAKLSRS